MPKKQIFHGDGWFTPNDYGERFKPPPPSPGVYMWVHVKFNMPMRKITYKVLYVGSTKNIEQRFAHHEKRPVFKALYGIYIMFFFKETDNYYEEEKSLIKATKAKFNVQWK